MGSSFSTALWSEPQLLFSKGTAAQPPHLLEFIVQVLVEFRSGGGFVCADGDLRQLFVMLFLQLSALRRQRPNVLHERRHHVRHVPLEVLDRVLRTRYTHAKRRFNPLGQPQWWANLK